MSLMTVEDIKKYIPHRDPMLMIDTIESIDGDNYVVATKNVRQDEPHFKGHFPGHPVMPGVLIVEALAQAAGVMMFKHGGYNSENAVVYFMKLDNVRFRKPVVPDMTLTLKVEKIKDKAGICVFRGKAYDEDDTLVSEAEFMAKIIKKST